MGRGRGLSVGGGVLLVLCRTSVEGATTRNAVTEERIRSELVARAPQAVANLDAATKALDAGEWETAIAGYRGVLLAAPDFTPAMRRMGGALIALDRYRQGLALTERAVDIERSPEDLFSLALALARPGSKTATPDQSILKRAAALAREASLAQPQDTDSVVLWAQTALRKG